MKIPHKRAECGRKNTVLMCSSCYEKFAWPPAKGVSKNRQQSPILVTVPCGYWTQGFLEFRKDTIYSILRRGGLGVGCPGCVPVDAGRPSFRPFKNHSRNRSRFPSISEAKMLQNPSKNHSKSIPGAIPKPTPQNNKNIQNETPPNLEH